MTVPVTAGQTRAARSQVWRDLAALLDPTPSGAAPLQDGRRLDWHRIYAVAAGQMVAPTLHAVLAGTPQRWGAVPAEVQQALTELNRLNAERNARLRAALRHTVQVLNAAGIEPLLLKGSITLLPAQGAHRFPHHYPQAQDRYLGDLDIALQNADAEQAAAVLQGAGWRVIDDAEDPLFWDQLHHLAPMADPSGTACIELHHAVLSPAVAPQALPLAALRNDAVLVEWDGLRLWVPSLPHRVLHNVLHDAVQDMTFDSGFRSLRQLLELARLLQHPGIAALDWAQQLVRLDALGLGDAVRAQTLLCCRLFALPLPPALLPGKAAQRSERRYWFWIERPGWWQGYKVVRRICQLATSAVTPRWYPAKWRQLRKAWQAAT